MKSMAKDFDHLLSILPFEDEFFSKNGLNTTYVGHPAIPLIKQSNEKIIVSILPPLNYGLNKDVFTKNLEEKIYSELDRID